MPTLFISPTGSGLRDGSSIANAGTLADLGAFVGAAGPGGEVLLVADQGSYKNGSEPVSIVSGGTEGHPVTIRGIDSDGEPMKAEIVGRRVDPYVAGASSGEEVFRLLSGADNITFSDLHFENVSYAAIRVGADIANLTVEHVSAENVQRFLEDYVSGDALTATISGLTVRDVQVDGFSKGAIRLQYDTHDVLIEDVRGDSQRQNGDNFAIGVHLGGTVHDVEFHRVAMRNAFDNVSGAYWQGDGFASEKGVYNVLFEDTIASGNTDAGYDLKSSSTTLVRAISEENGRNFRIWGQDVLLEDVVSIDPTLQGGIANQQHFGFARGAEVTFVNPYASDSSKATIAFDAFEGKVTFDVENALVHLNADAKLFRNGVGSVTSFTGTDTGIAAAGPGIADFSGAARGVFVHGDAAAQILVGSAFDDVLEGGAGDDALLGGEGDDRLSGGAGNDLLIGGAGRDILIGGAGNDTVSYAGAGAGVDVDLVRGAPGGAAAGDLLEGIENLFGSASDDGLRGDSGVNRLFGGEGDDRLDGRAGDDILVGGSGADVLIGGDGTDVADYSASEGGVVVDLGGGVGRGGDAEGDVLSGIEVLVGSRYADFLQGGAGDDVLHGGGGADELHGGAGTDTVDFGDAGQAILIDLTSGVSRGGDAEGDRFVDIEIVRGTAYADTLVGDASDNVFYGGGGDDLLDGAGGNDRLIGGAGADRLIGGDGIDTVDYSGTSTAVSVDLGRALASGGDADGDTFASIENVVGTLFADTLVGDAADNRLDGGAGDDLLAGGAGADTLVGGAGYDTATYAGSTAGIVLSAGGGAGDAAGDTLVDVESVVGSGFGDDLSVLAGVLALHGGAGDDILRGGAGDDWLEGGAGADTILGGSGLDTADYSASAGAVTVDLGTGSGQGADADGDVLVDVERIVGSRFADVLTGGDRDDVLIGGAGGDRLSGGAGVDVADYSASGSAVSVDLAAGTGSGGDAAGDTLAGIEIVVGSAFADVLVGDASDNRLIGGAGADTLRGGAGQDVADYSASAVGIRVDLSAGTGSGGTAEGDVLSEIEGVTGTAFADTLTGNGGANTLVGGAGNDVLDGGGGDDILIGGLGDDQYVVDSLGDVVSEEFGAGSDRVITTLSGYTLGTNIETLVSTGTGPFVGFGNEANNSFVGGAAAETFYGLDGDDRFFGSLGADVFYGGAGANSVDYSKSKISLTINLTTNVNRNGDAEGDLLYDVTFVSASDVGDSITGSAGNETIYGRGGADTIYGLDGDDVLDGGAGADHMEGGRGNDTYLVESAGDQIVEDAGAGIDLVRTTLATYTLGANLERLMHTGSRAFTGTGNELDNEITGGSVGDRLSGGLGNDILAGRGGADTLDGGAGIDTASYATSTVGVTADLGLGRGFAGEAQGDAYIGIENLIGSGRADLLTGDAGANRIDAGTGDDRLSGAAGDDVLSGGAGNDRIDGGDGFDTAEFAGNWSDYGFGLLDGALLVRDLRAGSPDGVDQVTNVETFRFADRSISVEDATRMALERPPSDLVLSGTIVAEDAAAGTVVGIARGFDANGNDDLVYALADDAGGRFVIDEVTGALSVADGGRFDHETQDALDITIVVRDPGGLSYSRTVSITVADRNEAPTAIHLVGGDVAETAQAGTVVGTAIGTDPDRGEMLRYTLTDDAGGHFLIDSRTGTITTAAGATFDRETVPAYTIRVRAEDGAGASTEAAFVVAVDDVNEAPTSLTLDGTSVAQNAVAGTLVGRAIGQDQDVGDWLRYALVDDAGGRFVLEATTGELRVAPGATIGPAASGYTVGIEVIDAAGATRIETFVIAVAPLPQAEPYKGDAPDQRSDTFLLDTRTGGTTGNVAITNFGNHDVLVTTTKIADSNNDGIIAFSTPGVLSLSTVRATLRTETGTLVKGLELDGTTTQGGVTYYVYSRIGSEAGVAAATLPGTGTSSPDDLTLSNVSVSENATGATIGAVVGHDPRAGATLRYSLVDDAGGRFVIDAETGVLKLAPGTALDFEAAGRRDVTVAVTNETGGSLQKTFAITVVDVNEAPTAIVFSGGRVAEGAAVGTLVGTVSAIDPDAGDGVRYSLTDDAGGRFAIDADTGALRVAGVLDHEAQASHPVVVRVTDGHGLTFDSTVAITVDDRPETFAGSADADVFVAPTSENWTVNGLAGDDVLTTSGGNDVVTGGAGNDVISTGAGDDVIRVSGRGDGFDRIDGGAGHDAIVALARGTTIGVHSLTGIELVDARGFADVLIAGSDEADTIDLSSATLVGITRIAGNAGDDIILGSAGSDVISGGGGDDVLSGGAGDDVFQVWAASGRDTIDGGSGYDTVRAEVSGAVFVWGDVRGIEAISGNGFSSVDIAGTSGADVIDLTGIAISGIRAIVGGAGDDRITGSAGDDVIRGGLGSDLLAGGAGADLFDFDAAGETVVGAQADRILDFVSGTDRLDLSTIDASSKVAGNQAFVFVGSASFSGSAGQVRIDESDVGVTHVFGDTDGNGIADFQIDVVGRVVASDFIL